MFFFFQCQMIKKNWMRTNQKITIHYITKITLSFFLFLSLSLSPLYKSVFFSLVISRIIPKSGTKQKETTLNNASYS